MLKLLIFLLFPLSLTIASGTEPNIESEIEKLLGPKYQLYLSPELNIKPEEVCEDANRILTAKENYYLGRISCDLLETEIDLNQITRSSRYLLLAAPADEEGKFILQLFDLEAKRESELKEFRWTLFAGEKRKENLVSTLEKVFDYDKNGKSFREKLLKKVISLGGLEDLAGTIEPSEVDEKLNTEEVLIDAFVGQNTKNKNYWRAALEVALFLGAGTGAYILQENAMKEDWDFIGERDLEFWKDRVLTTNSIKFDDNAIAMNWGHVYAGYFYYSAARTNGLSGFASLLTSMAASSFWEYVSENKEVVSINDQILTGIGGAIMGEAYFQIGRMLRTKNHIVAKVLAHLIDPVGTVNNYLDGDNYDRAREKYRSHFNYDAGESNTLEVVYGLAVGREKEYAEFGFDAEVIHLPIEKIGSANKVVMDVALAEVIQRGAISPNGFEDFQMISRVVLASYFKKSLSEDEQGRKNGYSLFIGPSVGTEYNSQGVDHEDSFYAVAKLIGGSFDISYYRKGVKFRFSLDVHGDFALVRPHAGESYLEAGHNYVDAKNVLEKRNYYYAYGASTSARFSVDFGRTAAGVNVDAHYFTSIDDPDLERKEITKELHLEDTRGKVEVWVSYDIRKNLVIKGSMEFISRGGKIEDINGPLDLFHREHDNRFRLQLIHRF